MDSVSKLIKQSTFKMWGVSGVLLLFSLSGCSKVESDKTKGVPICFTANQQSTKASSAMTSSFTVIGYDNLESFMIPCDVANWDDRKPLFVENFYSDGAPYNTDNKYYYDGISFYDFVAYAPVNGGGIISSVMDNESTAAPSITFTPPIGANVDLLTACAGSHKGSSAPLNLTFYHALTRIRFSAVSEYAANCSVVIDDLKYTVTNQTNSIDYLKSTTAIMDPKNATGGIQTYALTSIDPTPLLRDKFRPILAGVDQEMGCFYVVPQQLKTDKNDELSANITVTYTISRDTDIRTKTSMIKLIDLLESGKDVHYKLTFSPDQIFILRIDDVWENFPLDNGEI